LANIYANIYEIGSAGDPFPEGKFLNYLLKKIGIEWVELSGLHKTVLEDIEKAKIFLQVSR
jgi:hypothetical protein